MSESVCEEGLTPSPPRRALQVQYVGMGRMGAKLDAKAWRPEVETVSAADIRTSLGLAPPDKGSASTSTMGGSRGEGGKRRRNINLGSYPKELVCPIGGQLMTDPVIAADGFSYEVINPKLCRNTKPCTHDSLCKSSLSSRFVTLFIPVCSAVNRCLGLAVKI